MKQVSLYSCPFVYLSRLQRIFRNLKKCSWSKQEGGISSQKDACFATNLKVEISYFLLWIAFNTEEGKMQGFCNAHRISMLGPMLGIGGTVVKNLPANAGDAGLIPGSGKILWVGNRNGSSILAWTTPRGKEPGALQSIGSQRVWHDWANMQIFGSQERGTQIFLLMGGIYIGSNPGWAGCQIRCPAGCLQSLSGIRGISGQG